MEYDPQRIIECETGAEALQWEAAERIAAGNAAGRTQQAIAREIGKGQPHVCYMIKTWKNHLGDNPKPPFNEAYQAAKAPKVKDPEPQPEPEPDEEPEPEAPEGYEPPAPDPIQAARFKIADISTQITHLAEDLRKIGRAQAELGPDVKEHFKTLAIMLNDLAGE